MNILTENKIILGCLLGTAVGDAIGLPAEGLSRRKALRFCGDGLYHRLVFGRGMFSDDTEHTLMVAVALKKHGADPDAFQQSLAWSFRWWLLALPAGVGLSTAKSILRLWLGFGVEKAGVRSAGNGAAMRSAIIGAYYRSNEEMRHRMALAACRLTHTDPRAEESVLLVAEAAALAANVTPTREVLTRLRQLVSGKEMGAHWTVLEKGLEAGWEVSDFANEIGCGNGVSGFAPNTVAVALFAWLRHRGDFRRVICEVVACGGDTDTVAAIAGGIFGAESGKAGIPAEWIRGICDWPRSTYYIRRLAASLADSAMALPKLHWWAIPIRNVIFLLIVLGHGFRRILPTKQLKTQIC